MGSAKRKKKPKPDPDNPRETSYPEQGGDTSGKGDAYNGDDKHGPLEEEYTEQEKS